MAAALLDTNAISDLMRDNPIVKGHVLNHADPITTSVIVAGEIRYGLDRLPPGKKRADLENRAQIVLAPVRIEPVTEQIAQEYGMLKAASESQGLNLFDNDLWIAATAIVLGSVFVTRDQAFSKVPGLQTEDWSV